MITTEVLRDVERAAFLLMVIGISLGLFLMGFVTGYMLADRPQVVFSVPAVEGE